jgi:hypothetical protein
MITTSGLIIANRTDEKKTNIFLFWTDLENRNLSFSIDSTYPASQINALLIG